jgi:hypothetical protein
MGSEYRELLLMKQFAAQSVDRPINAGQLVPTDGESD